MNGSGLLAPALALVGWTFVMWGWVLASRLPLFRRAMAGRVSLGDDPERPAWPAAVARVSDNYNHLHEQPTLFYAVAVIGYLLQVDGRAALALAWTYVGLRVVHSLVQATRNVIPVRFLLFLLGSGCLMALFVLVAAAAHAGR
jgi:hypothetical protein